METKETIFNMRNLYILSICIFSFSCTAAVKVNTTYNKQGIFNQNRPIQNYKYLFIQQSSENQEPNSQITLANSNNMRYGNLNSIIAGAALKAGLTVIDERTLNALDSASLPKVLIAQWGISGRTTRDKRGTYSQEVTVVLSDFETKEAVYKGIGEYLGQTELDDLKGALGAALMGLNGN
jgi:hypothetical protein